MNEKSAAFVEEDVLMCCALSFDGYRYVEETGFDHLAAFAANKAGGAIPEDLGPRRCLFFMLQRFLYKWGGETLEGDSSEWRLFRELFLSVAREPVPAEFAMFDESWSRRWRSEYEPRLAEVMDFVRGIHVAALRAK